MAGGVTVGSGAVVRAERVKVFAPGGVADWAGVTIAPTGMGVHYDSAGGEWPYVLCDVRGFRDRADVEVGVPSLRLNGVRLYEDRLRAVDADDLYLWLPASLILGAVTGAVSAWVVERGGTAAIGTGRHVLVPSYDDGLASYAEEWEHQRAGVIG